MTVHLLKLCVGISEVAELEASVRRRTAEAEARGEVPRHRHITRQTPRRAAEILDGGSLYWVISGFIQVRQRILGLDDHASQDGILRCAIQLEPRLHATQPMPRRPFQGWRYLDPDDAPADAGSAQESDLPPELRRELAGLGLL